MLKCNQICGEFHIDEDINEVSNNLKNVTQEDVRNIIDRLTNLGFKYHLIPNYNDFDGQTGPIDTQNLDFGLPPKGAQIANQYIIFYQENKINE